MIDSEAFKTFINSPQFLSFLGSGSAEELAFSMLGQGEYNLNYSFTHPVTGQALVLRINTGSQMHLEKQTAYEYNALRLLIPSGRTPRPLFYLDPQETFPYGTLVMEFLPGGHLDYRKDLKKAAMILADIHRIPVDENSGLLFPASPLRAIYEESLTLASCYFSWDGRNRHTESWLRTLLHEIGVLSLDERSKAPRCIVNTELNSGNFLMNPDGPDYLVDWEKPLLSEASQDLAHFLSPTTTFWKTDVILTKEEMLDFTDTYIQALGDQMDPSEILSRLPLFLKVTCLRGIAWCAMAQVEYSGSPRLLKNSDTQAKIEAYLEPAFLEMIVDQYIRSDFL